MTWRESESLAPILGGLVLLGRLMHCIDTVTSKPGDFFCCTADLLIKLVLKTAVQQSDNCQTTPWFSLGSSYSAPYPACPFLLFPPPPQLIRPRCTSRFPTSQLTGKLRDFAPFTWVYVLCTSKWYLRGYVNPFRPLPLWPFASLVTQPLPPHRVGVMQFSVQSCRSAHALPDGPCQWRGRALMGASLAKRTCCMYCASPDGARGWSTVQTPYVIILYILKLQGKARLILN